MSGNPYAKFFARKQAMKERKYLRDSWGCVCRPMCDSYEAHRMTIDAQKKAVAPETIIERIAKFSVEQVTNEGVLKMITSSELYVVSENGVPMHFVAYPAEPYEAMPHCVLHPNCESAIACVAWRLKHSMETGT